MSLRNRSWVILSLATILIAAGCSKKDRHLGESSIVPSAGALSASAVQRPAVTDVAAGAAKNDAAIASHADAVATDGIKKLVETEKAAAPDCFTISFHHKKTSGHSSDEECSKHKNVFHLPHTNVNAQSLCVRVNGRPVAFQLAKAGDVTIGALAGPEAKITARYCLGKVHCAEECKVPRDEFMEALGGAAEENEQTGKWDASDGHARDLAAAKVDSEIRKEMAEMEEGVDIFKGWLSDEGTTVLACSLKNKQLAAKHNK